MEKGRVKSTVTSDGEVTWVGRLTTATGDLRVTQETSIYDGDATTLGLEVTVTLENVGDSELANLCYSRNVDPDQEQPLHSLFSMYIVHYIFFTTDFESISNNY